MKLDSIELILKYFVEYGKGRYENKYYFHKENASFKIVIDGDNKIYQLNTDHEPWGIELETIDDLRIRYESFTGENIEYVSSMEGWED